ncbi:hypothetical protein ACO0QE_003320 [Hanseniaspora vineae]
MDSTFPMRNFSGNTQQYTYNQQNGMEFENKRVYPLYQVFTDPSVSLDEKSQLVTAFKKHIKLRGVDLGELHSYFDAFFYYLSDVGENIDDIIAKEHQSSLFPQFDALLYSTFCHLIARVCMQSPISITKNLIKDIMLVFMQNDVQMLEMGKTKNAIEGMFLCQNELFDNVLLNDFLLNEQISVVIKCNILETIQKLILPLTTKDLMIDENNIELMKKHQQYLFKFNVFLQKQLNKNNMDKLRNCMDSKQGNEKLTQYCLEICENYNIPYLNQTKTKTPASLIRKNTFTPKNYNETISNEKPISLPQQKIGNSSFMSEHDKENIKPMFDTLETELQRIISSKSNGLPSLTSSTSYSSSSQSYYTSSTAVSANTTRTYTSLEYFFKELHPLLSAFQLKENESNWKKRQSFILKLRSFLSSSSTTFLSENSHTFIKHFKEMKYIDCIHKAVHSLRTTLSSNACMLIKELCSTFKKNLDAFQEQFFEILKPLLSSTKKLSVNNAHMAILSMLTHCSFSRRVFSGCANLSRDKNVQPKICSGDYLRFFIIKSAALHTQSAFHNYDEVKETSAEFAQQLKNWVKNLITNPQSLVRSHCKVAFWYFYKLHPKMATHLLNDLNPQIKKSVEVDIPSHLNIQYPMPIDTSKSVQRESSVSRFKKFKALSQPPAQSAYTNQSPSRREDFNQTRHSLSRSTLRAHSDSSIRRTPQSSKVAPSTLEQQNEGTGCLRKEVSRDIEIPITTIKPSVQPASPFVSHTPKTTMNQQYTPTSVMKSYSKTPQEEQAQTADVSTQDPVEVLIEKMQAVSPNSFSDVEHILNEVVNYLSLHNVGQEVEKTKDFKLITALRQVALLAPLAFRSVIGKKPFISLYGNNLQYLNHLIELFAINKEFLINHLLDSLPAFTVFQSILNQIFSSEMDTGCQSSLFYVKYRKDILDYGLRSCIKLIELDAAEDENVLGSNYEESLSYVIKLWGSHYNKEVFFELITRFQIFNSEAFVEYVQNLPGFQKQEIAEEVKRRNSEFNAHFILGQDLLEVEDDYQDNSGNHSASPPLKRKRSLSSSVMDTCEKRFVSNVTDANADDVLLVDDQTVERKAMELTMVNPLKFLSSLSKQNSDEPDKRVSSTGSVVLHKMQATSAVDSDFTQSYENDTIRLSEMTKIIPAFSTKDSNYLGSEKVSGHDKGKKSSLEDPKENDEEDKDEKEIIDLSDLFSGSGAETMSPLKFDISNFQTRQDSEKLETGLLPDTKTEMESLIQKDNSEMVAIEKNVSIESMHLSSKENKQGVQNNEEKHTNQEQATQSEYYETMEEAAELKGEEDNKVLNEEAFPKNDKELKTEDVHDLPSLRKFLDNRKPFQKDLFPTEEALIQVLSSFVAHLIACLKDQHYADYEEYAKYTCTMSNWLSTSGLQQLALEFLPQFVSCFQVQEYKREI